MARRLFVALSPGEEVRAALADAAAELRRALGPLAARLRWTDPAAFHVTVRFLGDVPEGSLARIEAAVTAAAAAGRPLALEVTRAGAFPSPRRPRALALELGGEVEPLRALAASLEARLVAAGQPPEPRPLRPHLTVARARDRGGGPDVAAALAAFPAPRLRWLADALTLFESHLGTGGARHEVLRSAPLSARTP